MNYVIGLLLLVFIIVGSYFIYKHRKDRSLGDMEKILKERKERE